MSSVEEKQARSVFVGNIPHGTSEEQMKEIFSTVGTVLSFRIVYDRETGNAKGYGFAEYLDVEMGQSAIRNLNGYEFGGRTLRVDKASSQADELRMIHQQSGGPPVESPYGDNVSPDKAPEAISRAVASLPPEQMFELMKQMKLCIQNNMNEARTMLLNNPQLAYALLQAQVIMRIVEPQVAMALLHRKSEQIPPIMPTNTSPIQMQPTMIRQPLLPPPQTTLLQPAMPVICQTPVIQAVPIRMAPTLQPQSQPPPTQIIDPRFQQTRIPPIQQTQSSSSRSSSQAPPQSAASHTNGGNVSSVDQEKAALIMQVLQLTDDQIAMLPIEQRQSILQLKEQIAQSADGLLQ